MSTVRSPAHAPTSARAEQTLMTNEPMVLNNPSPTSRTAGNIGLLPIQSLKTSYACLRPGAIHQHPNDTAELPIRVVPTDDGLYEVIDGFKRLEGWREQGKDLIPVVLECPSRAEEHKRLLLLANSPPRTLTALDEARVVCSLLTEEALTQNTIARMLRRKPQWVARRVELATRLSPTAQTQLAHGSIGPTLAHALCALPDKDQDAVLGAIDRHRLKHREALVLVAAYRVADEPDRHELLRAPLGRVRAEPAPSPTTSTLATELEHRLERIREALLDLSEFVIPLELAPAEQRRLEARLRSVLAQLHHTARALETEHPAANLTGDPDDSEQTSPAIPKTSSPEVQPTESRAPGGDPDRDRKAPHLLRQPRDCSPRRTPSATRTSACAAGSASTGLRCSKAARGS